MDIDETVDISEVYPVTDEELESEQNAQKDLDDNEIV